MQEAAIAPRVARGAGGTIAAIMVIPLGTAQQQKRMVVVEMLIITTVD